jgi:proline iminopeptidase
MSAGMEAYLKRTAALKTQMLSPEDSKKLTAFESTGHYDSPEYAVFIRDKLYPQMLCRTKPWPNAVDRALEHMNRKIYIQMQGKSEFVLAQYEDNN